MKYNKHALCGLLMAWLPMFVAAQGNGSNSSYTRFGLGALNDRAQGFNRSMSGLSIAQRGGSIINMQNPASYSAIDSLTFLFDAGVTLQNGNYKSGAVKMNVHNTSLDYVNAAFRIRRGLGFSFGFVPYTTIGYDFAETDWMGNGYSTHTQYSGSGGLHEIYLGLGWSPFKHFSIGANVGYLWGKYEHYISRSYYETSSGNSSGNSLNRQYKANLHTYKIDLGAQYVLPLGKDDELTVGITAGIGHNTGNSAQFLNFTSSGDTLSYRTPDAFDLPYSFGGGLAWKHKSRWMVGADVLHERWSDCKLPQLISSDDADATQGIIFRTQEGAYSNRTKITVGTEFVPNVNSNKYAKRIHYRIGAVYSTPYFKVNGGNGPKEYGISGGVALPITNRMNGRLVRSVVNVGLQWSHIAPAHAGQITENYVKLNIGLTFNEQWFLKWKID